MPCLALPNRTRPRHALPDHSPSATKPSTSLGYVKFCYDVPMLIGIEASRANRIRKTGVEWYAYHVIQEMKKMTEALDHSWLLYANEPLMQGLERGSSNWHETRLAWPPKYLWTQIRLSWEMFRHSPDVLFVPAHVLPRRIPRRNVVTVHDVGFRRRPDLYKKRQVWYHEWSTKDIARRAARIITVSEFSKREIAECYHVDPSKIFVTPLGYDHARYAPQSAERIADALTRFRLPTPFFLFVGRLERKKNIGNLLEAFLRFKQARGVGDPYHLVLAGIPGEGYDAFARTISGSPHCDAIHVVGYINEDEKIALMSGAEALVHPARYEGFGITPVESLAGGTSVLCSRASSLPEVVGEENAFWFDPADPESLEARMHERADHPEEAAQMAERGRAWVARYDWSRTAAETFKILTSW